MRSCPRCENRELTSFALAELGIEGVRGSRKQIRGLVVDLCESCYGVFTDAGKAETAMGVSGRELMSADAAEPVAAVCESCNTASKPGAETCPECAAALGLPCPGCAGRMLPHGIFGVELDVCGACEAMWFDEGELTKVIRRYKRRQRRSFRGGDADAQEQPEEQEQAPAAAPEPKSPQRMTCIHCKKEGLRPREVYKTKDGPICRACFPSRPQSDSAGLSAGMMHDNGIASNVVNTMATLAVVDAICDLFSD